MDATMAASVAATDQIAVLQPGGFAFATLAQIQGDPLLQIAALAARVAALEGRPEEAAHFTATAKLPTIAALASVTLTLTGLIAARAGDALKADETVSVEPAAPLPPGLNLSTATVPADGTVAVQMSASVAIAASATPILWNITALR